MEGMGSQITADPPPGEGQEPPPSGGTAGEWRGELGVPERRKAILDHLRSSGEAEVSSLPALFGVSLETIRRDLRELESTHAITRTYGHVALAEAGSFETGLEFRLTNLTDEKKRIARAAVERLGGADTVFLDEGFQPLLVGRALPTDHDLTIITASLHTALEMARRPRTTVISIGGRIRPLTMATVERWATAMLRDMQPDLAIIGANGVSLDGWMTTPDPSVAEMKETALSVSSRALFVGSHTKFDSSTLCRFAHARAFERVITGTELGRPAARRLISAGARLVRA